MIVETYLVLKILIAPSAGVHHYRRQELRYRDPNQCVADSVKINSGIAYAEDGTPYPPGSIAQCYTIANGTLQPLSAP